MSEHEDFLSLADMTELDEQILARAGEEGLSDRMKREADKKTSERAPWTQDLRENWFSYLILSLSFLLTEMTAFYLGTAPALITNPNGTQSIEFHNDAGHLITTLVYMLLFPVVTEIAFGYFRNKFDNRETGNFWQQVSAGIGSAVALISIVGTGVSGTYVIFSTLGSVGFLEVPRSVQGYLIWVIPILIALFGLLAWIYGSNSEEAQSRKRAEEDDRKAELNDRIRMREIERAGTRAIRAEAIRVYQKAVSRGLLSHKQASEAMAEGLSLADLERKLRRDLTGEGKIGDTSGLDTPGLPSPSKQDGGESDFLAGKYNYLRPPYGDRNHVDLTQARIPPKVWETIIREWAIQSGMGPDEYPAHLGEQIGKIPAAPGTNGATKVNP